MKFLFILLSICLLNINNSSASTEDPTTLDIINQIESNLMYQKDVSSLSSGDNASITRGWDAEKFKYTEEKMTSEIKSSATEEKVIDLERQAYKALQQGHTEVAINLYKKAIKQDPKDSYALLGLATSYHKLGQYRQAKPIYLKLLEAFPGNEQIIANLLSIVVEESPNDSVPLLQSVAERNPNSSFINAQTSVAFANIKDYKESIKYLNRALKLDRNNIQYQYNLAILYDMTGRYNDAIKMYNEVIRNVKYDSNLGGDIPVARLRDRIKILKNSI